ncbi:MAG: PEP-CTERM sorting domain-containing protein [Pirellulales bacterium]
MSVLRWVAVGALCTLAFVHPAQAGTMSLNAIADQDSAYFEQPSGAYFQMDQRVVSNPTQQRFLLYPSNAAIGNPAFDGFPHDEAFRLGSITFNDAGLGGNGVATITAVTLGIGFDPFDSLYQNFGRWSDLATTVNSFSGTVTLVNGLITSVNMTSNVSVSTNSSAAAVNIGPINATGPFNITGNRFDALLVSATATPGASVIYDFGGTLTAVAVPEPSTFVALAGLAFGGVLLARRRRKLDRA